MMVVENKSPKRSIRIEHKLKNDEINCQIKMNDCKSQEIVDNSNSSNIINKIDEKLPSDKSNSPTKSINFVSSKNSNHSNSIIE